MLKETGRIVAIDDNAVWVEAIQRSTCGSCAARGGCGQSLLASIGVQTSRLRVLLGDKPSSHYRLNQQVVFGVPEGLVVTGSVLVYLLPLAFMLVFGGIAHTYFLQEYFTILSAVAGFLLGSTLVRWYSRRYYNDARYQPVVIDAGAPQTISMSD